MAKKSKTVFVWVLLLAVVVLAIAIRSRDGATARPTYISVEDALEMVQQGIAVEWTKTERDRIRLMDEDGYAYECNFDMGVAKAITERSIPYQSAETDSGMSSLVAWLLAIPILLVLLWFILKRMGGGGGMQNIFELRKTKARSVDEASRVKFDQIGGNEEALEALYDVVDFLKDPAHWKAAGARIPRGVLLAGPPGTGKTLLARAVAGETQAAFFYTSATEFVEMFVGVGAARVRDTFETAAKAQPAVIFIDELDAIGRKRSSGMGTMHEEREQTLNQLLVLMDGLERYDRLVVIAATNRPDVLDPALMRSGRFDRVVRLKPPTTEERVEILRIHMQQKPMDPSVSAETLVRHADGLTGADIEVALNEAAILAVRRSRQNGNGAAVSITEDDVRQAVANLKQGNRQFNTLDVVLVESVTQLAEPTGRAVARITTVSGKVIEGEVVWMNANYIKLKTSAGEEVVVAREMAERIEALKGTEIAADGDISPDRWTRQNLDVR